MAEKVSSPERFSRLLERRKKLFREGVRLPEYVFMDHYELFRVADYNAGLLAEFYDLMLEFSRQLKISEMVFIMVDPDPSEYYYSHFGKYGVITIDCNNDAGEDIINLLLEGPPESDADIMLSLINQFSLFPLTPEDPDWCVWGDRDGEATIVALKDRNKVEQFLELDGKWAKHIRRVHIDLMTTEPIEAVNGFMRLGFRDHVIPDWFKNPFLKNYDRR